MTAPILAEVLTAQRRSLLLWGMALAVIVGIYTSVYPTFADTGGIETQLEALPPAVVEAIGYDQAGTAAGYVQSTIFTLLGMVLLLVHAIGRGSRVLAGQEEDGSLELELTSAVSRTRVYLERTASVLLASAALAVVVTGATAAMGVALDLDLPAGDLLAAGASLYLLVDGLGWLGHVTPMGWHLGADALVDGADPVRLAALALTAVVAIVAGLVVFSRRDLVSG